MNEKSLVIIREESMDLYLYELQLPFVLQQVYI